MSITEKEKWIHVINGWIATADYVARRLPTAVEQAGARYAILFRSAVHFAFNTDIDDPLIRMNERLQSEFNWLGDQLRGAAQQQPQDVDARAEAIYCMVFTTARARPEPRH